MNTSPPIPPWKDSLTFAKRSWSNNCREAGCYDSGGTVVVPYIDGVPYQSWGSSICPSCRVKSATWVTNGVEPETNYGTTNSEDDDGNEGIGVYAGASSQKNPPSSMDRWVSGALQIVITDGVTDAQYSTTASAYGQMVCQVDDWAGC